MIIIFDILWILVMLFEFFIICGTYYYLKREYSKVTLISNEKDKIEVPIKKDAPHIKSSQKNIVKQNITQRIDIEKINSQVMYARLTFMQDKNCIASKIMSQNKLLIGRDLRSDIVIKEHTVSRKQCIISLRDNTFILKNFATKNITCVNGETIEEKAKIKYGDVIKMGNITFIFDTPTDEQPLKQIDKPLVFEGEA